MIPLKLQFKNPLDRNGNIFSKKVLLCIFFRVTLRKQGRCVVPFLWNLEYNSEAKLILWNKSHFGIATILIKTKSQMAFIRTQKSKNRFGLCTLSSVFHNSIQSCFIYRGAKVLAFGRLRTQAEAQKGRENYFEERFHTLYD